MGAAAICQGTGGAVEVLQDARGPPGPLCTVRVASRCGPSLPCNPGMGKKSCMNGGLRSCSIQPKLFDRGVAWLLQAAMGRTVAPPGPPEAGRMPGHRQGRGAAAGRLGPSWAAPAAVRAWRMPGHRQGGGGAAGFLWPSWAAPGAVRAGRCPGKHSKWMSICKISGALARMLFPIPGL